MNPRQRAVIWVGVLVGAGMGLYPPWSCANARGFAIAIGYSWIFVPPREVCYAPVVDTSRLLIGWAVLGAFVFTLYHAWPRVGELKSVGRKAVSLLVVSLITAIGACLLVLFVMNFLKEPDFRTLLLKATEHPWMTVAALGISICVLISVLRDMWSDLMSVSHWISGRIFGKP